MSDRSDGPGCTSGAVRCKRLVVGLAVGLVVVPLYYVSRAAVAKLRVAIAAYRSAVAREQGLGQEQEQIPIPVEAFAPEHGAADLESAPPSRAEVLAAGVWRGPGGAGDAALVGSVEGARYHDPSCRWARNIRDQNLVWFATVRAARDFGYTPCATCQAL